MSEKFLYFCRTVYIQECAKVPSYTVTKLLQIVGHVTIHDDTCKIRTTHEKTLSAAVNKCMKQLMAMKN